MGGTDISNLNDSEQTIQAGDPEIYFSEDGVAGEYADQAVVCSDVATNSSVITLDPLYYLETYQYVLIL